MLPRVLDMDAARCQQLILCTRQAARSPHWCLRRPQPPTLRSAHRGGALVQRCRQFLQAGARAKAGVSVASACSASGGSSSPMLLKIGTERKSHFTATLGTACSLTHKKNVWKGEQGCQEWRQFETKCLLSGRRSILRQRMTIRESACASDWLRQRKILVPKTRNRCDHLSCQALPCPGAASTGLHPWNTADPAHSRLIDPCT